MDLLARQKGGSLGLINSIQFDYIRFVDYWGRSDDIASVSADWLVPKQKTIPIINVDFDEFGAAGPIGTNMVVVFRHGLLGKPVAEGFGYGADNSSDHNSWGWSFKKPDARGYLAVQSELDTKSSVTRTLLQWNGKYFVPRKSPSKSWMI